MTSAPKTMAEQDLDHLKEILAIPEHRHSLVEASAIAALLQSCILDKNYRVPDELVRPIRLTAHGEKFMTECLAKNRRLKISDVRLATFLKFGSPEGLFVDKGTDIEGFRKAIQAQVLTGKIRFPYVFGRDLHDVAARRFPGSFALNNTQTLAVLSELPIGVFQVGFTTVGPLGCLKAITPRSLPPSFDVLGYYCSDATCDAIHSINLSTATTAPTQASINKAISITSELFVERYQLKEDHYAWLVSEASREEYAKYPSRSSDALIEAIADSLADTELLEVAEVALRLHLRNSEDARALSKRLSRVVQNPRDFVDQLTRAERLHLLLLFSDANLEQAIDQSVALGAVKTDDFYIRIARINRFDRPPGRPEIGPRGLRYTGDVSRRLMQLLYDLYYVAGDLEPDDLSHALRGIGRSANPHELLDLAIQNLEAEEVLRSLVLPYRKAIVSAQKFLGVTQSLETDEEKIAVMLWKLGVPSTVGFQDLSLIHHHGEELERALSSDASQDALAGLITPLFKRVENALQRSLEFAIWTLTTDHFLSETAFIYDSGPNGSLVSFINQHAPSQKPELTLWPNGKNTVQPLAAGFGRLAKALNSLSPEAFSRPESQYPSECRITPRPFAFTSVMPFLDLADHARAEVMKDLKTVADTFGDALVLKVRNTGIHGNNEFPSVGEIRVALEKINRGTSALYDSGLYPRLYELGDRIEDPQGRRTLRYASGGEEVALHAPLWTYAPRLPMAVPLLLIMPHAVLRASGPLRFSLSAKQGDDPYWKGWPKRWERDTEYLPKSQKPDVDDVIAG